METTVAETPTETQTTEVSTQTDTTQTKRLRGPGRKEIKLTHNPDYFNEFYRKSRSKPCVCENCGRVLTKAKMFRHVKTLYCARHTKDPDEIRDIASLYFKVPA